MKTILRLLAASALCAPALAQNAQVSGLPARGTPAASDQVPVLPVGATHLQATTVGAIAALGGGGGGFTLVNTPCNGVADDTAAIQAAINTGANVQLPAGTCVISSSLLVENPINDGQTVRGAGSWGEPDAFNAVTGGGATVIKPTSAVTAAFVIDGTPFAGGGYQVSWVQGFSLQNFAIDMANMSDISTSIGVHQIQAWDGFYERVRMRNDGSNKRGFLFTAGAFTTIMLNTQSNIIDMEGTSGAWAVTTITVINHDGFQVITNWANGLKFYGGAYQGAGVHFQLANASDLDISTDVEGSGTYIAFSGYNRFIRTHASLGGMAMGFTKYTGTCNIGCELLDNGAIEDNYVNYLSFSGFTMNGFGNSGAGLSAFLSGSTTQDYSVQLGRTAHDYLWGLAANAGDYIAATAAGDMVLEGLNSTGNLWFTSYQNANSVNMEITPTAINIAGGAGQAAFATTRAGSLSFTAGYAVPTVDGQIFTMENAAGNAFMLCKSFAILGNSLCSVGGGADWQGYSDGAFSVETYDFDSAGGNGRFSGALGASALNISSAPFTTPKPVISATSAAYGSGFSGGTPTIAGASTAAFTLTLSGTPGSTGTLTMPGSYAGWACMGVDRTTAAGTIRETSTTTTSVTFALASTVASDVLQFECLGY